MSAVFEEEYIAKGLNAQRRYPNESLIGFLAQHFFSIPHEQRADIKLLDLGCGSGANLWAIAREGFNAYGLGHAATGLKYCAKILQDWGVEAQLTNGDFCHLPYNDNFFDGIVDIVSLQHINFQSHLMAWAEIYRCLTPGGKFFSYHLGKRSASFEPSDHMIDACTVDNIKAGLPLCGNRPTCFLSSHETKEALKKTGFQSIKIENVLRSYDEETRHIEYLVISAEKPLQE